MQQPQNQWQPCISFATFSICEVNPMMCIYFPNSKCTRKELSNNYLEHGKPYEMNKCISLNRGSCATTCLLWGLFVPHHLLVVLLIDDPDNHFHPVYTPASGEWWYPPIQYSLQLGAEKYTEYLNPTFCLKV